MRVFILRCGVIDQRGHHIMACVAHSQHGLPLFICLHAVGEIIDVISGDFYARLRLALDINSHGQ